MPDSLLHEVGWSAMVERVADVSMPQPMRRDRLGQSSPLGSGFDDAMHLRGIERTTAFA